MAVVQKKIDVPFDIPLPIVLDDSFFPFKYTFFSRGCNACRNRWQPTVGMEFHVVGDDSLHCEEEKDNEHEKYAVTIIYDSFHLNKVVGHVPLYWSELANRILKFLNHHIPVIVTGKRTNRGICLGLEIPID